MHDLTAIYNHVHHVIKLTAAHYFDEDGNAQLYPRSPKFSDLELITLAITAECFGCDSENLLYYILATDYPGFLDHRPHRANFNRRRRRHTALINTINAHISGSIDLEAEGLVTDSVPVPTAEAKRESRSRACRNPGLDALCANKTYHASLGKWYVGYKLHLIETESGLYVDHVITPASWGDTTALSELIEAQNSGGLPDELYKRLTGRRLLADKGYDSDQLRLAFDEDLDMTLSAPMRENRKDWLLYPFSLNIRRKSIETTFSQLCDEMRLKLNRAKRFSGLCARVATKLLARTIKQWINYQMGRPLRQTKHCFAYLKG